MDILAISFRNFHPFDEGKPGDPSSAEPPPSPYDSSSILTVPSGPCCSERRTAKQNCDGLFDRWMVVGWLRDVQDLGIV